MRLIFSFDSIKEGLYSKHYYYLLLISSDHVNAYILKTIG